MNDITTTPTADLLAEWGNTQNHPIDNWPPNERKAAAIASELDRRCKGVVENNNGMPRIVAHNTIQHCEDNYLVAVTVKIPMEELRDLLTWILLKGGNNGN